MSTKPTEPKIERRYLPHSVAPVALEERADENAQPTIGGYAAVFYDGTPETEFVLWDGAVERIMPTAFDRALEENDDVRGLFNHNPDNLLARTTSETLTLTTDKRGLRYAMTPGNTNVADDVVEHVKRGDLTGSSFAFEATDVDWRKEDDVEIREISGVRLYDVGPVTYPAYEGTTTGVRSGDSSEARRSHDAWQAEIQAQTDAAERDKAHVARENRNRGYRNEVYAQQAQGG